MGDREGEGYITLSHILYGGDTFPKNSRFLNYNPEDPYLPTYGLSLRRMGWGLERGRIPSDTFIG